MTRVILHLVINLQLEHLGTIVRRFAKDNNPRHNSAINNNMTLALYSLLRGVVVTS
jgi:hypothetical protein